MRSREETSPNERLVLFSDAVIAITITLLVLEIRLPEGFGELSDAELWRAIVALWPRLMAYLISFAVIAVFWVNHRAKFDRIERSDKGLTWLNFLFLMTIGLIPFTTTLIAESPGAVGTAVYAGVMVASGLSLALLWLYASAKGLVAEAVTSVERRRLLVSALLSSLVFAVSVPVAFGYPDIAKFLWLLLVPINLVSRGVRARMQRRVP